MSTFCPLCGSAVDDGETCSCQSKGIQPEVLEGLIQEQTMDFNTSDGTSVKQAAKDASKQSVGVDIEIGAPRKQSRPTPDMSFGANPMMRLDLGLDDEPVRPARQAASTGVDIGRKAPQPADGVDIGRGAPQPAAGVNIGRRAPQPAAGVDIGRRAPQPAAGVDTGRGAPQPAAGVDIGRGEPQPADGVDIGRRAPQPQSASQRPKRDVLREKYEQQDRMIMEKAGLLPKEEEKPPEPEEMFPAEKYTVGEFFEDLKYDPVDAIENFVENGSILFAILFMLAQAVAAGVYTGVFALRYSEDTTVSGAQFMLAFVTAAMFMLLGNIILAFVETKMLEGSSSEAYIQRLVAVISMYSLASAPCLLLAAIVALLSPLISIPFAAAAWTISVFIKSIAFGGLRDLDRNRIPIPVLASCGIQGVIILLIGLMVKILMG